MTTTAIFAVIINILLSIVCYFICIEEVIKKSVIMSAYYQAQGTAMKVFNWASAIVTAMIVYGLILYTDGGWNTVGWILYWTDTIGMLGITVVLKIAVSKQLIY